MNNCGVFLSERALWWPAAWDGTPLRRRLVLGEEDSTVEQLWNDSPPAQAQRGTSLGWCRRAASLRAG